MKENKRKCFKCGSSPVDDPETTLYRFPKPGSTNILRCELWAKYCCPDKSWSNKEFQLKLHTEHRMLCHRHFNVTAFVDFPSKKLKRFASPDVKETSSLDEEPKMQVAAWSLPCISADINNTNFPHKEMGVERSGCRNQSQTDFAMHRFPDAKKFPERFKTYVNVVGGRLETLSDFEYYKNQVICDVHFCETYRNRNNRLNALAVPTLHLTGLNLSQITSGQASTSTQHNLEPTLIQQENSGNQGSNNSCSTQPTVIENSSDSFTGVENSGNQDSNNSCSTQPTVIENSSDSFTGVENSGNQDSNNRCTTQPTVTENSSDSFTGEENSGNQDSNNRCTTQPTVIENSSDSFTGVENSGNQDLENRCTTQPMIYIENSGFKKDSSDTTPKKLRLHCFFGCQNDGPLHSFPNPNSRSLKNLQRFEMWKSVLPASVQKTGNNYIYHNIRLCNDHFLDVYRSSHRLTRNAVPTLRLEPQDKSLKDPVEQSAQHNISEPSTSVAVNTSGYASGKLDPEDVCTAQPTVTDNSNDSFTAEDYNDWVPAQCETAPVESAATAPSARQQFCICCLQQAVPLLSLLTCAHADFLNILMIPQIQPTDRLVCYHCHLMLKKIKKFKRQVQESFKLLSGSSSEISLKKYSNQKHHLTIHETLNLEIPGTNEESPTTDTKEVPAPKSSYKDRKRKNIEEALKIINRNQNSEYFDLLSTSLKSISQSLISEIYTDFQSTNTTDFITSRQNDLAINEDRIDTDGNSKEEVEEEEEYIILDVRERADVQAGAGDARAAVVKNITLSREELSLERAALLSSAPYVRARHRCRSCVVAFAFRDNLADHVRRKHTPPPHNKQAFTKCRVCRQFVRRDAYNIHRAAHYNRYECVSCAQTFSSYDDAASHYRKQHTSRDTQLKCPRCSFSTTRRRLYKKHSLVCNTRTVSAVR